MIHHPSGARGESREFREQRQNTKAAFRKMAESAKFRIWRNRAVLGLEGTPEERAEKDMHPSNLLIMGKVEGKWKVID